MNASATVVMSELQQRGDDFGRELAAALILAGERAGRDRDLMREMTAIAAREMRVAVDWLREGNLPERLVNDYERACRNGFRSALHRAIEHWRTDRTAAQRAA
jgi:hypothetical protein